MKKKIAASALALLSAASAFAQSTGATTQGAASASAWKYIGAAVAVSVACLAGGIAVARIGAAAMGAMAEKPELSGNALPYVGLAEGICLWGFLVALLILLL